MTCDTEYMLFRDLRLGEVVPDVRNGADGTITAVELLDGRVRATYIGMDGDTPFIDCALGGTDDLIEVRRAVRERV